MEAFPHQRIVVIGTTGSGKSTLALELSRRLHLDFVELDGLHWQAGWRPADREEMRLALEKALLSQRWVVAGNYSDLRDLIWPSAQAVVWLDYPLPLIFWRLLVRTLRRSIFQEELWNGNREKFWWHLKLWSDESLFHWLFKTYWRRKRETPILLAEPAHIHLELVHLTSSHQARAWLASLPRSQPDFASL